MWSNENMDQTTASFSPKGRSFSRRTSTSAFPSSSSVHLLSKGSNLTFRNIGQIMRNHEPDPATLARTGIMHADFR